MWDGMEVDMAEMLTQKISTELKAQDWLSSSSG